MPGNPVAWHPGREGVSFADGENFRSAVQKLIADVVRGAAKRLPLGGYQPKWQVFRIIACCFTAYAGSVMNGDAQLGWICSGR